MKTNVKNVKEVKTIIETSKNLMNDDNLLNLDLDSIDNANLDLLVNELAKNIKQKKETSKDRMYKNEVDKKQRQILRKKRNKFVDNVLFFQSQKMLVELKNEINLFNEFYKEVYLLNDYSLNSICQNNSDNETKIKSKLFLQIIKNQK
jgi:RNA processing factor Prp31